MALGPLTGTLTGPSKGSRDGLKGTPLAPRASRTSSPPALWRPTAPRPTPHRPKSQQYRPIEATVNVNVFGPKKPSKHKDPTNHDFWYPPECEILMFLWVFGPINVMDSRAIFRLDIVFIWDYIKGPTAVLVWDPCSFCQPTILTALNSL